MIKVWIGTIGRSGDSQRRVRRGRPKVVFQNITSGEDGDEWNEGNKTTIYLASTVPCDDVVVVAIPSIWRNRAVLCVEVCGTIYDGWS
jgi:hypothetical protein